MEKITKNFEYITIEENKTAMITRYKGNEENVIIPSKIEGYDIVKIGDFAFYNCNSLISITIPSSLTHIGYCAFYNCSKLTNVTFEDNSQLEEIGSSSFRGCGSLTNVYYSGTIEDWCNITFDEFISNPMSKASHFYMLDENNNYKEVTSIEIPSTVTVIGEYQFYGFNNVTSIIIPNSVTGIYEGAFYSCDSLTSITIPSSVATIGNWAFFNCTSLTTVIFEENSQLISIKTCAFSKCKSLTNITIPSNVTYIGNYAFYKCSSLTNITIPNSVKTISLFALKDCDLLTIYCEAKSKPEGWNYKWNYDNRPVIWGHKK